VYLGIDLGTSGVKLALVDEAQRIVDQETAPLSVQRPRQLWSEQDPEAWWRATAQAVEGLRSRVPGMLAAVRGIGLSGQMHGATLLDAADQPLRPAILWNDGRSGEACRELERRIPEVQAITGNLVMPGFTAPKLVWLQEHEPAVFRRVARVLLPKDYLRLRLSGEYVSDMSDAAGTLWLDVARRCWSPEMVAATRLGLEALPRLVEGTDTTGVLRPELADRWGMARGVEIAGGGGDQAAGAVGAGVVDPGQALLSLGTSGVIFVASDVFSPNPTDAVHAFCHALPQRWHQMSVVLSAASCLTWVTRLTAARDEAALLAEAESALDSDGDLLFLPYLSGERTPHNDPHAKGVFFGLTHEHGRADLARAVLEGVAFAFVDAQRALSAAGTSPARLSVVGGGARSPVWGRILASALGCPLDYATDAEVGPAFGAARLARLAVDGGDVRELCTAPPLELCIDPEPALQERYGARQHTYRELYRSLRVLFESSGADR